MPTSCCCLHPGERQQQQKSGRSAFILEVSPEVRKDTGFIDLSSKQGEAKLISHHLWAANTQVEGEVERPAAAL